MTTYELLALKGEESKSLVELLDSFAEGLSYYKNQEWEQARSILNLRKIRRYLLEEKQIHPEFILNDVIIIKNTHQIKDWDGVTKLKRNKINNLRKINPF